MEKTYTTQQVAGMLKVSANTVKLWIKKEKLRGSKVGKGWRISEENLREAFPEWAFSAFADTIQNEQGKLVQDVSNNKNLYKELYTKEYERDEANSRDLEERLQEEYWLDRLLRDYREEMRVRLPYPYTEKDVFKYAPDGTTPLWTGADPEMWEWYYEKKLKEEKLKFNKLLELFKNKYKMEDIDIKEIKQTADNIKLLELAGFKDK